MTRIQKLETWSVAKVIEANSLEEALEKAKLVPSEDWQYVEDDSVTYYAGDQNG